MAKVVETGEWQVSRIGCSDTPQAEPCRSPSPTLADPCSTKPTTSSTWRNACSPAFPRCRATAGLPAHRLHAKPDVRPAPARRKSTTLDNCSFTTAPNSGHDLLRVQAGSRTTARVGGQGTVGGGAQQLQVGGGCAEGRCIAVISTAPRSPSPSSTPTTSPRLPEQAIHWGLRDLLPHIRRPWCSPWVLPGMGSSLV